MGISNTETVKNKTSISEFIKKLKDNLNEKDVKSFLKELADINSNGLND
jgi:hypothetical protein